jgi:hypothetical protein
MAHFAHITNGIVDNVIVIDAETLATGHWGDPQSWIQTSYNTQAGVHNQGGIALRKNFAGVGFTYDQQRDAFIPPKPFASWTLDETTCQWQPPIARPTTEGKFYDWDETTTNWKEITIGAPTTTTV